MSGLWCNFIYLNCGVLSETSVCTDYVPGKYLWTMRVYNAIDFGMYLFY